MEPRTWLTYAGIADLFGGPTDCDWASDRDKLDQSIRDPMGHSVKSPAVVAAGRQPRARTVVGTEDLVEIVPV